MEVIQFAVLTSFTDPVIWVAMAGGLVAGVFGLNWLVVLAAVIGLFLFRGASLAEFAGSQGAERAYLTTGLSMVPVLAAYGIGRVFNRGSD